MSNNFTPQQIVEITIIVGLIGAFVYAAFESAKAKAFNEGFKRGRASVRFTRSISQ